MMRRGGPGLIRGVARTAVVAGTATAVSGRVARRQANRFAEQDPSAQAQQEMSAQPAPPAAGQVDTVAQIQQLASLKDQGLLTEDEFAAKKKQILGI